MARHQPIRSDDFMEVAGIIGVPAMEKLCERFGGTRLYVPHHIGPNHEIALVIGLPLAQKLAEYRHATTIVLPKAHLRRQRVIELAAQPEMTINEIALATDYCERQVRRILGGVDDGQGSFDF